MKVTPANIHDVCVTADLLTGEKETVHGDSGYLGAEKRPEAVTRNKAGIGTAFKEVLHLTFRLQKKTGYTPE